MKRNQFLRTIGAAGTLVPALPLLSFTPYQEVTPLDKALVKEFVGESHKNMEKVKTLLEAHPTLLNAAHDWGRGDFETGLGAASHVGYKELVRYFLDKGAQANIFTFCLFGKTEMVKAMLGVFPMLLHAKGPHGFTLLHHAERGGEEALEVKALLLSLGAKETKIPLY